MTGTPSCQRARGSRSKASVTESRRVQERASSGTKSRSPGRQQRRAEPSQPEKELVGHLEVGHVGRGPFHQGGDGERGLLPGDDDDAGAAAARCDCALADRTPAARHEGSDDGDIRGVRCVTETPAEIRCV